MAIARSRRDAQALPTTLQADESNGGLGTNGHRYVEGVTRKQLPAAASHVLPSDSDNPDVSVDIGKESGT
jgi:hypothetical protein